MQEMAPWEWHSILVSTVMLESQGSGNGVGVPDLDDCSLGKPSIQAKHAIVDKKARFMDSGLRGWNPTHYGPMFPPGL
jgi:hypothetical protein